MRSGSSGGGCIVLALILACASVIAEAQPSPKVYRIGWLGNNQEGPSEQGIADFRQGLRDLGYIDGKDFVVEYRNGSGNSEKLSENAAELAHMPVEVIVAAGDPAALAAKRATRSVNIVAIELGLDPVKAGLVQSLGRPEGNVTGLATQSEELWQKRLALLKQLAPGVSRITVLADPLNPTNQSCAQEIRAAAPALGLEPRVLELSDARAVEPALASIAKAPPDALVLCWNSTTLTHAKVIADFALSKRLPTLAPLREYVQAGALISFGTNLPAQRRRAAYYVDKIAKGAKPASLPVEQPSYFELVVNLKTAKALGVAVPPGFLVLADELIQ